LALGGEPAGSRLCRDSAAILHPRRINSVTQLTKYLLHRVQWSTRPRTWPWFKEEKKWIAWTSYANSRFTQHPCPQGKSKLAAERWINTPESITISPQFDITSYRASLSLQCLQFFSLPSRHFVSHGCWSGSQLSNSNPPRTFQLFLFVRG
jgi:hypothetical protein